MDEEDEQRDELLDDCDCVVEHHGMLDETETRSRWSFGCCVHRDGSGKGSSSGHGGSVDRRSSKRRREDRRVVVAIV